jgi:5'(3')-deoxyribonucleotidase
MQQKRVLIDMDDVMANLHPQFAKFYYEATGKILDDKQLEFDKDGDTFQDRKLLRSFLHKPGFFRALPVMENAQEVVEKINKKYEVFVVSAALEFPQSLQEKHDWLQEHFPYITWQQIIFCGSKKPIHADYMIDDHLKNLDNFSGEKLLFTAAHNKHIEKYTRVNNWQEVANVLL